MKPIPTLDCDGGLIFLMTSTIAVLIVREPQTIPSGSQQKICLPPSRMLPGDHVGEPGLVTECEVKRCCKVVHSLAKFPAPLTLQKNVRDSILGEEIHKAEGAWLRWPAPGTLVERGRGDHRDHHLAVAVAPTELTVGRRKWSRVEEAPCLLLGRVQPGGILYRPSPLALASWVVVAERTDGRRRIRSGTKEK